MMRPYEKVNGDKGWCTLYNGYAYSIAEGCPYIVNNLTKECCECSWYQSLTKFMRKLENSDKCILSGGKPCDEAVKECPYAHDEEGNVNTSECVICPHNSGYKDTLIGGNSKGGQ